MVTKGQHSYGDINCKGNINDVIIGKFCQIGENVTFDCGINHNSGNISTYPFHLLNGMIPNNNVTRGNIIIGNDIWVGMNSIIMSGVTIADGAIIGAGSIITKDVSSYTVVVGANRFVRDRFSTFDKFRLLEMKWWDWSAEQIEGAVPFLHSGNVDGLYEYHEGNVK